MQSADCICHHYRAAILHQPERGLRFKGREAWRAGSAARLHSLDGDNAALGERVGQLIAVVTEQGFPFWRALGTIHRGWFKVKNVEALAKQLASSSSSTTRMLTVMLPPRHLMLGEHAAVER